MLPYDFPYSIVDLSVISDRDIARIGGLVAGMVRNLGSTWKSPDISKEIKVNLYQTLVQSILLYNPETWTFEEEHKRKLQVCEMSVLRRTVGETRRNRRRNIDINKDLGIDRDVLMVLQQRRLTYFEHVVRMGPEYCPLYLYTHISAVPDPEDVPGRDGSIMYDKIVSHAGCLW